MLSKAPVDNLISETDPHTEYYKHLVDKLPVAIYTCDKEGYIRFYNQAAVNLWGREPEVGKDLWCGSWKIFYLDGTAVSLDSCPMAITLKQGVAVRGIEIIVEKPDGQRVNVLPHPDPIFDKEGKQIGAVNMLVDISDHKQTQESNLALKQYNSQLEQFAFAASHDMQEPLRKIHTFSNLLAERHGEQLDDQGKNYLNKITQSAGRMHSIIQDLLDYSRQTATQELIPTDLNLIIKNIESDLELLISNKAAVIEADKLPVIKAIPTQINRLFYNLIQNSLKFSRTDVPPHIRISLTNEQSIGKSGRYFEIIIRDNGIGFEQKYAERIFELFQRLNDKYSFDGNGIGLSLCKKIVENHQGFISAESETDQGTSFLIKLPVELMVEQ